MCGEIVFFGEGGSEGFVVFWFFMVGEELGRFCCSVVGVVDRIVRRFSFWGRVRTRSFIVFSGLELL